MFFSNFEIWNGYLTNKGCDGRNLKIERIYMSEKGKKLYGEIKNIAEKNGGFFVRFDVDENGMPNVFNFGNQTSVMNEIIPYMFPLELLIRFHLEKKPVPKNETYTMKFSVENGFLRTEIWGYA